MEHRSAVFVAFFPWVGWLSRRIFCYLDCLLHKEARRLFFEESWCRQGPHRNYALLDRSRIFLCSHCRGVILDVDAWTSDNSSLKPHCDFSSIKVCHIPEIFSQCGQNFDYRRVSDQPQVLSLHQHSWNCMLAQWQHSGGCSYLQGVYEDLDQTFSCTYGICHRILANRCSLYGLLVDNLSPWEWVFYFEVNFRDYESSASL